MLVNGQWQREWNPVQKQDKQGRFIRQTSSFRTRFDTSAITQLSRGERPYTLYVALICPWATRVLIARSLLGLEDALPIKIVAPAITDYGWEFSDFPGATPKAEVAFNYMHELYTLSDPHFTGRATVPLLWDNTQRIIVNNESADLLAILNDDLRPLHQSHYQLRPEQQRSEMEALNQRIYSQLNNGVYQAGFAQSQHAYIEAYTHVFAMLDELDNRLASRRYLFGDRFTESDIRLFVTLARFDVAYYGIFKTNRQRIADFAHLNRYFHDLIQIDAFAKNTNVEHIKVGYYSIKALNPTQIIPQGPKLDWFKYLS
ncbi:glutathione S-transferase family protein [Celerinatantimonas yamalensis]|uniref:Glutathione S-transferase C-terminal domain-containing protein n=1 Tax=Celerinatantimonas yamalensis TaxID=559956 RepID=A0ABW9G7J0_9GAMM